MDILPHLTPRPNGSSLNDELFCNRTVAFSVWVIDETDVYVCVCIEERNDFDGGVGGVVTTLKCNFYISPPNFSRLHTSEGRSIYENRSHTCTTTNWLLHNPLVSG